MPTREEARQLQQIFKTRGGRRAAFRNDNNVRDRDITISVQGLRAVEEHFEAVAELTGTLSMSILDFTGVLVTDFQRTIVPVDTGATQDSIHYDVGIGDASDEALFMEAGPTTFYSPFLEYGTVFMSPRSFVIPSANAYEAAYISAMLEVAQIADQIRTLPAPYGHNAGVTSAISAVRHRLYSAQRALGDIQVLGATGPISNVRSGLIFLARGLGDVNSILRGAVGARVTARLRGRATGRIIGFGSATISVNQAVSAQVGGEVGQRAYQRIAGRIINRIN